MLILLEKYKVDAIGGGGVVNLSSIDCELKSLIAMIVERRVGFNEFQHSDERTG